MSIGAEGNQYTTQGQQNLDQRRPGSDDPRRTPAHAARCRWIQGSVVEYAGLGLDSLFWRMPSEL